MKKPESLAQQVLKAQKVIESWPEDIRANLRLEGSDIHLKSTGNPKVLSKSGLKKKDS